MHGETVHHLADPLTNGSTNVRIRDGRLLSEDAPWPNHDQLTVDPRSFQ